MQFCGDDDAGTDLRLTNLLYMVRYASMRVSYEVGHDVGIEQIAHQRSIGSVASSGTGGNFSSIGFSLSSTARRDFGGVRSMINRSPFLRMMASFPGSSNSRGIRTAWFLPFLNSFTCCSRFLCFRLSGICFSICQLRELSSARLSQFGQAAV